MGLTPVLRSSLAPWENQRLELILRWFIILNIRLKTFLCLGSLMYREFFLLVYFSQIQEEISWNERILEYVKDYVLFVHIFCMTWIYTCITMYSKFLSEAIALWLTSCTNFILIQWVEVLWQHLPAVLPAIFVTVNMSLQIVDEEGNILPNNVEGNVGLRVKPHRPVGLFTKYVVKSPNQLN